MSEARPRLSPRRMITILAAVAASIMAVHLLTLVLAYGFERDHVFGLRHMFDVDRERNVPAIFSLCLLLISSCMLAVIAYRQKPGQLPRAALWAGLSAVFFYLALDEGLELHERVAAVTAQMLGGGGLRYYAWLLPYAIGAFVFFLMYRRFLSQLPRETRRGFFIAGALYVGGAMGTEVLAATYVYFFRTEETLGYDLLSALEESLEMAGIIVFIYTLARYLGRQQPSGNATLARDSS